MRRIITQDLLAPLLAKGQPRLVPLGIARRNVAAGSSEAELAAVFRSESTESLMRRLSGLNRAIVPESQKPTTRALAAEIQSRSSSIDHRGFRETLTALTAANLNEEILALYRARELTHGTDVLFTVFSPVVEAAYNVGDAQLLVDLGVRCCSLLSGRSREIVADFSLFRIIWRLQCLTVAPPSNNKDTPPKAKLSEAQALDCIERMWNGGMAGVVATYAEQRTQINEKNGPKPTLKPLTPSEVAAVARRCVLYNLDVDMGEMHFFRRCKQERWLRSSCATKEETGEEAEDTYYQAMIRSCAAGKFVDVATEYFTELRAGRETLTEFTLFAYLNVLIAAKDHKKAATIAHEMCNIQAIRQMGGGLVANLATSAGEVRDRELALTIYDDLINEKGNEDAVRPASFVTFAVLNALARCYDPDITARIEQCKALGILTPDAETELYLELVNGLASPDPLSSAAEVEEKIAAAGITLTYRMAVVLLKLYFRMESPLFLERYRMVVDEYGLFRSTWLEELVLWADRRRYSLTSQDRRYVIDQVSRHCCGGKPVSATHSPGIDGMRPHISLMQHDLEQEPLANFKASGTVGKEPPLRDPKLHFATKRTVKVLEAGEGKRIVGLAAEMASRNDEGDVSRSGDSSRRHGHRQHAPADVEVGDEEAFLAFVMGKLSTMQQEGSAAVFTSDS